MSDGMMSEVNGKPEQYKKLFIGGLKPETDENSLKEFYSKWGEIVDVVVIKDPKTSKSRGFGFVTFATGDGIDAAQINRPHEIDGKVVDSKRAMPKNSSSPNIHANVNKIFVGGLKKEITEEHMKEYFEKFGNITEVSLVRNKQTNESKKFGFVTFDDNDTVDKIILSCPHKIKDSKADVNKAVSKEEIRRNRNDQGGYGYNYGNNSFNQNVAGGQSYDPYGQSYGNYGYQGFDSQGYDWSYGASGDFGAYNQGYVGGPIRGPGNQIQPPRPGPYQNNFQMR